MRPKEFWTFVSPSVLTMLILMVAPVVFTVYLSFQNFTYGVAPSFVGLENYVRVLTDGRFWDSLGFTLTYTAVVVPAELALGFGLALLLHEIVPLRRLFISAYLFPFVVTPVVGTLVVGWLFRDRGFLTYLLSLVGVEVQWFADPTAARALVILFGIWQATPFAMLMLYAGLQAMPHEPIEAATVDGASWTQRVRHVVVPQLGPIFLFIVLIGLMDAFRVFDSVAVMTKGGPGTATETVMYYNYSVAFGQQLLGRGAAVSVLTVLGILVLLVPSLYRTYREQRGLV